MFLRSMVSKQYSGFHSCRYIYCYCYCYQVLVSRWITTCAVSKRPKLGGPLPARFDLGPVTGVTLCVLLYHWMEWVHPLLWSRMSSFVFWIWYYSPWFEGGLCVLVLMIVVWCGFPWSKISGLGRLCVCEIVSLFLNPLVLGLPVRYHSV